MQNQLQLKNVSFNEFYTKLEKLDSQKIDIIKPASQISMVDRQLIVQNADSGLVSELADLGIQSSFDIPFNLNQTATNQLLTKLGIGLRYGNAMLANDWKGKGMDDLFTHNVNEWLKWEAQKDKERAFLIRGYDSDDDNGGIGRAFLSNRFGIIDNFDVIKLASKAIMDTGRRNGIKIDVETCSLTEKKMYVRFIIPELNHKIKNLKNYRNPVTFEQSGGNVVTGFILSNSEVGHGQLTITPSLFVDACSNGCVWYNESWQRKHLGAKLDNGLINWSNQTHRHNSQLIMSQIKDTINKFVSPDFIGKKIEEIEAASNTPIENPINYIKNLSKHCGINDDEVTEVLNYFMKQGSQESVFDGVQAITYFSQTIDEDRRFEMEAKVSSNMVGHKRFDVAELVN